MTVQANKVVTLEYELQDEDGEIIDSSEENGELVYLHGTGFLVPGIERELEGKPEGTKIDKVIVPSDGYGEYEESLVFVVQRSDFEPKVTLEEGLEFEAEVRGEFRLCTIAAIDGDKITVDANHPLAGETIHVKATILAIRDASAEELEHGHAHGPDDHHHH